MKQPEGRAVGLTHTYEIPDQTLSFAKIACELFTSGKDLWGDSHSLQTVLTEYFLEDPQKVRKGSQELATA
jgi:hypothetical protein